MPEESITFRLVQALCSADFVSARHLFGETLVLDGALCGRVTTYSGLAWAVRCWPFLFVNIKRSPPRFRAETRAENRIVTEVLLPSRTPDNRRIDIPFAIAGDLDEQGLLREARYYFCEKPVTGMLRPRLTSFPDPEPVVSRPEDYPDVNSRYLHAQITWNHPDILAQFGEECYIERGLDTARGHDDVLAFYKHIIIPGTPVRVVKNTGTYDGISQA